MVVKIMRWPPWPPLSSKKFEALVIIQRLEGLSSLVSSDEMKPLLVVEIKWKGQKGVALSSLRRSIKRNFTTQVGLNDAGVLEWNQEFRNVCTLNGYEENGFYPWEVMFTVSNVSNQRPKTRASVVGIASINLADYVHAAVDKENKIVVPLNVAGTNDDNLSLCVSLSLLKLEALEEYLDAAQRSTVCVIPSTTCSAEALSINKDDFSFSSLRAGLRKVKYFTAYVSAGRAKKASCNDESSDSRSSNRSKDAKYRYTSDTDSLDDYNDAAAGESEKNKEDSSVKNSFSYEILTSVNYMGRQWPYTSSIFNDENECWAYYSGQKSDFWGENVESYNTCDQIEYQISKYRILFWRKRTPKFGSSKVKGELLLKRNYGEEGGDDIDYDRRQLSSSDEYAGGWWKETEENAAASLSVSDFGENNFVVGSWEHKEVTSRDGHRRLHTQVFFASIDQRNERALGEGACAVLVAMIADWLKENPYKMPIKCEFDSLIRDGSSEWRNLCENRLYIEKFPDKHFDLDTVLRAKIRPVSVILEKSFVGFFIPEQLEGGGFDFLHGAMSFDSIWEEISRAASEMHTGSEPLVYIVSWNDHFFVLKVEYDAYYIIDTLGERLHEGCNQAYILKFDTGTKIEKLANENQVSDEKPVGVSLQINKGGLVCKNDPAMDQTSDSKEYFVVDGALKVISGREEIICRGKESCKEYIKSFLAAIPISELQDEVKKGFKASKPLHHRLQIEFHYTDLTQPLIQHSRQASTTSADAPKMADWQWHWQLPNATLGSFCR